MSDAKDTSPQDADSEPQGPLGGERLAEARRDQQISVLEIAKELHLDEPKVRALERNEFDMLGAPVFAKGHMRKYAQLVGVDEGDVLADYYQLTRTATIPPVISVRPRPRREMSPGPWIAVIVVIIVVATAYWWFTSRPVAVDEQQPELLPEQSALLPEQGTLLPEQSALLPEQGTPLPEQGTPLPEPATASIPADDSSVIEPVAAEPDTAEPATADPAPAPLLADGQMRLLVTYSGDCWTEITDASGRRLFFDLGTDGRTVELSGAAPFNVLFGNADNVSLEVNGSAYAIDATERRGLTARLTISGS